MLKTLWTRCLAGGIVGIAAAWGAGVAAAQSAPVPAPPAPPNAVRIRLPDASVADGEEEKNPLPVSDYWIGIALGELPEVAKLQLGLKQGIVVADVLPDSPAAKAEFKAHDILIKAGDANLQGAADLIKAVDAAKEKELGILIVRGGKEQTIKVTPIKRPKADSDGEGRYTAVAAGPDVKAAIDKIKDALSQLESKSGNTPLKVMLARPGVVPQAANPSVNFYAAPSFPKNLSIQINKKGDQPATIHVEKDGKSWDVTEGKLDDLPEDVRTHVQQFLGQRAAFRLPAGAMAGALPGAHFEYRLAPPAAPAAPTAPAVPAPPTPARAAVRTLMAPVPAVPGLPGTPATPQVARLHAYRVETAGGGVETKLDAIIKKLDQLDNKSVEQLEKEVKQLRKELDELRSRSPGERRERNE